MSPDDGHVLVLWGKLGLKIENVEAPPSKPADAGFADFVRDKAVKVRHGCWRLRLCLDDSNELLLPSGAYSRVRLHGRRARHTRVRNLGVVIRHDRVGRRAVVELRRGLDENWFRRVVAGG